MGPMKIFSNFNTLSLTKWEQQKQRVKEYTKPRKPLTDYKQGSATELHTISIQTN